MQVAVTVIRAAVLEALVATMLVEEYIMKHNTAQKIKVAVVAAVLVVHQQVLVATAVKV
jgi:hypothetical protein